MLSGALVSALVCRSEADGLRHAGITCRNWYLTSGVGEMYGVHACDADCIVLQCSDQVKESTSSTMIIFDASMLRQFCCTGASKSLVMAMLLAHSFGAYTNSTSFQTAGIRLI